MNNLENLSPVEIDTIYLERLYRLDEAESAASRADRRIVRESGKYVAIKGQKGDTCVRNEAPLVAYRSYSLSEAQPYVLDVQTCVAEGLAPAEALDARCTANEALSEARVDVAEINAIYAAAPWSRYWLVTSSDGHIHRSCHCSTCNKGLKRTGFALTAYLSGKTAEEAVADLGPALCSVCFPEAPVESTEQARISARLALCLAQKGAAAFQQAREEASAKTSAKAAEQCPGSGQKAVLDGHRAFQKCPHCGQTFRTTSGSGKVRPHKAAKYIVRQAYGSKCWTGTGWGTSSKAAVYGSRQEANAVVAQVSTPEEKAESFRK